MYESTTWGFIQVGLDKLSLNKFQRLSLSQVSDLLHIIA